MSQSPLEQTGGRSAAGYFEAIDRWSRLVQSGRSHSGHERNCAFLNLDGERYASISAVSGLDFDDDARAVVPVDWDHDGDMDLWLANRTGPQLRMMRNNLPEGARSLSLKLVGKTVNRDAVGARVEVHTAGDGPVRVRHLSAGSGFLSQGSKWLHIGLGETGDVSRVVVRWPGGGSETFEGLRAGGRYRLVQQAGRPDSVAPRRTGSRLSAAPQPAPEATRQAAIHLASRPPAPVLRYRDWDGAGKSVGTSDGKPVLVNLWASWCAPCAEELDDLSKQGKQLAKANVEVIALSVDGLGDERSATAGDLQGYLQDLEFPHPSGRATAELVDKLELLFARSFGRHVAFPVPTSFLLDADGALAAIYMGRVDVAELLADVERLQGDAESLRARATPFSGRWLSDPRSAELGALAREYLRAGYAEDAEPLLRAELESGGAEPRQLLATVLSLQDRDDEAERFYREAIAIEPTSARARYNYARLLAAADRHTEAVEQLGHVLLFEPANVNARLAFADSLVRSGRSVDALEHYRSALEARPRWVVAWNALIRQLAAGADPRVRDVPSAVQLAERVCAETENRIPELLDSLAVAYAAAGRFDDAVNTGRKAQELALAADRNEYAREIQQRVELFASGQPWVEPY